MGKVFTVLLLLGALGMVLALYVRGDVAYWFIADNDTEVITFNEKTPLRVTVIEERADLQRGLSGRKNLAPTEGLFFVFPEDAYHGIWMKDMLFSIDIIWLDSKGTVLDIEHNVSPNTYPKVFEPRTPARYVIETNAHFAESFVIGVGDTVTLPVSVTENLQSR